MANDSLSLNGSARSPAAVVGAVTTLTVVANACASLMGKVVAIVGREVLALAGPAARRRTTSRARRASTSWLMLRVGVGEPHRRGIAAGRRVEALRQPRGERAIRHRRHDVEDLELGRARTRPWRACRARADDSAGRRRSSAASGCRRLIASMSAASVRLIVSRSGMLSQTSTATTQQHEPSAASRRRRSHTQAFTWPPRPSAASRGSAGSDV